MNTHPHLEESLRRDIEQLRAKISKMAALSEMAIRTSVKALTERNRQWAYAIILRDRYIDELETEVDRLCLEFLARHQPVAADLRFIFCAIQINRDLERIGDYGESIARQVLLVSELEPQPSYTKFVELADLAIHMLRDAVQSFLRKDASLASRTMAIEERANLLRNSINADLRGMTETDRLPAEALAPLMTVARRLERVTDQAKNLCEEVVYMCTGEFTKHKGAEGVQILFVDSANDCLSQIAEAVANSLKQPGFVFSSAGLTPQPMNARMLEFMARKGIDMSQQTSKSLEQVPNWASYDVIVSFSHDTRKAIPVHSGKTIHFTWTMQDPCKQPDGSPETTNASFEEACRRVESHINELIGAILREPQSDLTL